MGPKILEIWDTLLHSDYSIKIYTPYSSFLCSLMVLRSSPPVSIFYTSEEKSGLTKILCGFPYANFSLSKLFVNVQQDIMLQLYINNTYVGTTGAPFYNPHYTIHIISISQTAAALKFKAKEAHNSLICDECQCQSAEVLALP